MLGQAPVLAHLNNSTEIFGLMWQSGVLDPYAVLWSSCCMEERESCSPSNSCDSVKQIKLTSIFSWSQTEHFLEEIRKGQHSAKVTAM